MSTTNRRRCQYDRNELARPRLEIWLKSATIDVETATTHNYADALRPVQQRLDDHKLQGVSEEDIDELVAWMLTAGRERGGSRGPGTDRWRLVPTRANGQPAAVTYEHADDGRYQAHGVQVLTLIGTRIARITAFNDPALVPTFRPAPARTT